MYDFKLIESVHQGVPILILYGGMILGVSIFLINMFITFTFGTASPSGKPNKKRDKIENIIMISSAALFLLSALCLTFSREYNTYEGVFKITESNAESVNNSVPDNERTITIKDKNGQQQTIQVKPEDGSFQKGKNAFIKLKTSPRKAKPSINKPIDPNTIKTIKQVN